MQMSRVFKDRPMTPFETAIYWVEYIGRHHGAHYYDPVVPKNMPLYQYLLLDVAAIILGSILAFITVLRWCCMKLCKCSKCSSSTDHSRQSRSTEPKGSTKNKEDDKKQKKKLTKAE